MIIDIGKLALSNSIKIFIDTNVWLYTFHERYTVNQISSFYALYSHFVANILKNKCKVFTNKVIISEFINAHMKESFKLKFSNTSFDFNKKFKRSSMFASYYNSAISDAKQILAKSIIIDEITTKIIINNYLNYKYSNRIDFNDFLIADLCNKNNIYLFTNDKDYIKTNCKIITVP